MKPKWQQKAPAAPESACPAAAALHHSPSIYSSIPPTHTAGQCCTYVTEKKKRNTERLEDRGGRKRGREREEGRRVANHKASMFSTLQLLLNRIFFSSSSPLTSTRPKEVSTLNVLVTSLILILNMLFSVSNNFEAQVCLSGSSKTLSAPVPFNHNKQASHHLHHQEILFQRRLTVTTHWL